jgi:hypothetical protein
MYSALGDTTSLVPGYPIRTSSDPRSVDNSPRHIAASHVLHRLPVPRHPPCALKHLQHKTKSFVQNFEIAHQHQTQSLLLDARNHYPQIKHHTPPPKTGRQHAKVLPQSPIVCPMIPAGPDNPVARPVCCAPSPRHYSDGLLHGFIPAQCGDVSWCSLERR